MPTKADLDKCIQDLNRQLAVANTDKQHKDAEIKRLTNRLSEVRSNLDAEKANKQRAHIIAAQMQGFIRAHHTKKRPTGNVRSEYNHDTGNYNQVPELLDVYPFMEIEF